MERFGRTLSKVKNEVKKINQLNFRYRDYSDEDLRMVTDVLRNRLKVGETLDDILPDAFAAVREASKRALHMNPYDVQMMGGVLLHKGMIAELKTGEGKTLVAALPSYLNALEGKGVHVITVNEYLAKRDSDQMSQVFDRLGLSTGLITHDLDRSVRKAEYAKDITYVTNSEAGFDYLRDNMEFYPSNRVQRGLHYCIIDEADSILIDEARTPLVISGQDDKNLGLYEQANAFVRTLKEGEGLSMHKAGKAAFLSGDLKETGDYNIDEKDKLAVLTDEGWKKAERFFGIHDMSDMESLTLRHCIQMALRANYLMKKDKDYILRDGEVLIVDEFTGRVMEGRRFADGLHQALEAKEHVEIHPEDKTLATITYQSFFNKYKKKSGMTGTAMTEKDEFREIYGMEVVPVPTNRPVIRIDEADAVYRTKKEKEKAVLDSVIKIHKTGQPILIGTATIQDSEDISSLLSGAGIPHRVLNAKQDAQEADIISHAGEFGAVTIATNMAGRGTDIKPDRKSLDAGGLYVIGTQRHESRRVDNQLRGRSGRQGDPGHSKFYISLEDDLMRMFGSESLGKMLDAMDIPEGTELSGKSLTKAIEKAQKKVEANNFGIRKDLMDYDIVLDGQRTMIYETRNKLLEREQVSDIIQDMIYSLIWTGMEDYTDYTKLISWVRSAIPFTDDQVQAFLKLPAKELPYEMIREAYKVYDAKEEQLGSADIHANEKMILLKMIDQYWVMHVDNMSKLQQAIRMQGYAQKDPVTQYKIEGDQMFKEMMQQVRYKVLQTLFLVQPMITLSNNLGNNERIVIQLRPGQGQKIGDL